MKEEKHREMAQRNENKSFTAGYSNPKKERTRRNEREEILKDKRNLFFSEELN